MWLFCILVGEGRLELPFLAELAPKASVSTNFTTRPRSIEYKLNTCPPSRTRTYDQLLKRQLLYQLSYGWISITDLNIIINFEKKTMCSNEKPARRPAHTPCVLFFATRGLWWEARVFVPNGVKGDHSDGPLPRLSRKVQKEGALSTLHKRQREVLLRRFEDEAHPLYWA